MTNINEKLNTKSENHDTDSNILLVDLTANIDEIQKILENGTIHKIISFDYESHELLKNNKITHEISDNYTSRTELIHVQNSCYEYVKWFADERIQELTNYDGINFGSLLQVELNYFLVQFIKKLFEIKNIYYQNSSSKFFASATLLDLVLLFTNSANNIDSVEQSRMFYYHTLKIPLKVGKYELTIQISKNYFNMLRRIFDLSLLVLSKPPKFNNDRKTTLAVEFDPIRYKNLFENLSHVPLNFIMFNRRKLAIWNFKSFSLIKRSGCSVITTNSISDRTVKIRIKNGLAEVNSKIESLWIHDDFFKSFFSINGISFWNALRPIFKELYTKRTHESISEIEIAKRIFEKYRFDSILVWSEIGSTEQIMIKLAKRLGIKIVLLQHGLFYDSESISAFKMNEFQGIYPVDADKYVIWGTIEKNHQIRHGIPNEKLMVLGSPLFDEIVNDVSKNKEQNYVLLATSGPVKENALDLTVETIERNRQTIQKICDIVTKMNKKLVIKLHPSQDEYDPSNLVKGINSNIVIKKTANISQLAKSCDIFIMIDASTVILEAHLLKRPVLSVLVKDSDYGIPSVLSESCVLTDMDNFETTFQRVLSDESFRKSMIEKGTDYVNKYLTNQGTASMRLLKFLANI